MRILLAASLFICQIVVAQNLVVQPSSIDGVEFIGPGDPAYKTVVPLVAGYAPPPAESDWLPYSAVLVNHTPRKILAVMAQYVRMLPNGQTTTLAMNQFLQSPLRQIQPDAAAIVLPGWIFMKPLPTGSRDATDTPDHSSQVQSYRDATRVELSLEAVVLESGQCVGPNEQKQCEALIAERQARQIYADVLSRRESGQPESEIVNWLTDLAKRTAPREPQTHVLPDQTAMNARMLLNVYQQHGAAGLYKFASVHAPQPGDVKIFR